MLEFSITNQWTKKVGVAIFEPNEGRGLQNRTFFENHKVHNIFPARAKGVCDAQGADFATREVTKQPIYIKYKKEGT